MTSRRVSESDLLSLIDLGYSAAQYAQEWPVYLSAIAHAVKGSSALLLHYDLRGRGTVNEWTGLPAEAVQLYVSHYAARDLWALSVDPREGCQPGRAQPDQQLVPRTRLQRSEFYNDFLTRFDTTRMVALPLASSGFNFSSLTIHRDERRQPFDAEEVRVLEKLAPHLRRALDIHLQLRAAAHMTAELHAALDALPCAVFVADGAGTVLTCNRQASAMRAGRDGLGVEGRVLTAATRSDTARLRAALAAAASTQPRTLPSFSILRPDTVWPLQVAVARSPVGSPLTAGAESPRVLVFASDPARERPPSEALLRTLYGLTPAQAGIVRMLATGVALERIAHERNLTLNTVRGYAKQVLAKLGCRTRAELARKVSISLPGLLGDDPVRGAP